MASSVLKPERAALIGRVGAHRLHATHDPRETTAKAREAFIAPFEREVDPEGVLPPEERERRAKHAMSAHFAAIGAKKAGKRSVSISAKEKAALSEAYRFLAGIVARFDVEADAVGAER
jgi:hypothetical protein